MKRCPILDHYFKLNGDDAMPPHKTSGKAKALSTHKKATKPAPPSKGKTPTAAASTKSNKTEKPSVTKQSSMPTAKQNMKSPIQPTAQVPEQKPQTPTSSKETEPKLQSPFSAKELDEFYQAMTSLRGRLTVQVAGLREQSLTRHDEVNHNEDGTDAFDRATSLDRASGDQSRINQINTAIRMIEEGTYGLCEHCSEKIEKPRLQALPFAKSCVKCQSEMEGGSVRQRKSIDLLD